MPETCGLCGKRLGGTQKICHTCRESFPEDLHGVSFDADRETFTELSVADRIDLAGRVIETPVGVDATLTWFSGRAGGGVSVFGHTGSAEWYRNSEGINDVVLRLVTEQRKGDILVRWRPKHIDNPYHTPLWAVSTGGPNTNRQPRLGELLDVEVDDA